ncbi:MAG: nicotinamide-nucleotide amidohydrolase family protein [Gemmatimonadota bacterium]
MVTSASDGTPRARVRALVVGSELLDGSVRDANTCHLGGWLDRRGGQLVEVRLLPDDPGRVAEAVRDARAGDVAVVVCGGLGPTRDDRTREAVAAALERDLVVDASAGRGRARRPRGAETLPNPAGVAPGFASDEGSWWIVALPGVPRELRAMLDGAAGAWIAERLSGRGRPRRRVRLAGIPESEVARKIEGMPELEGLDVRSYPASGTVDVVLLDEEEARSGADGRLRKAVVALRRRLGDDVYEVGDRGLAEVLEARLREMGGSLAVAESCTGGMLGAELTAVPGSSDVFWGGVVSYADEAKQRLLGVSPSTLASHGAVSEATAVAMARGVREIAGASLGVAVTGIAGPGGGRPGKPVGTVWIAVSARDDAARRFEFRGGRREVRVRSVHAALDLARRSLTGSEPAAAGSGSEETGRTT